MVLKRFFGWGHFQTHFLTILMDFMDSADFIDFTDLVDFADCNGETTMHFLYSLIGLYFFYIFQNCNFSQNTQVYF